MRETTATRLDWRPGRWLAEMRVAGPRYLLGISGGVAHFAVDVSDHPDDLDHDREQRFAELRDAAALLPAAEAGIAAQARANVDWHARHRYCGACGHPTAPQRGGQSRKCGNCGMEHFPRTDPVVIVVVADGDRCLLGQSHGRLSSQRMFSALAGFMDQGESIEEAVRREVAEESGVQVGAVRYHSSQPWPFPSSLMIGCHADALTFDPRPDDVEMQAVRWFDRSQVPPAPSPAPTPSSASPASTPSPTTSSAPGRRARPEQRRSPRGNFAQAWTCTLDEWRLASRTNP